MVAVLTVLFLAVSVGVLLGARALLHNLGLDEPARSTPGTPATLFSTATDVPTAALETRAPASSPEPLPAQTQEVTPPPVTASLAPTFPPASPVPPRRTSAPPYGFATVPAVILTATAAPPVTPRPAVTEVSGMLQLRVKPWAEVTVDGAPVGTTPLKPLPLSPGAHTVRFVHPEYKPLLRKVTIRAAETTKIEIDFAYRGVPQAGLVEEVDPTCV